MDNGAIGKLDALPAVVAIHGVIASHQSGKLPDAEFANLLLESLHEIAAAVRRSIPAIHEAVDQDVLDFLLLGHFQQCEQMIDVRVHAAIAEQAHQMQSTLAATLHGLLEKRPVLQLLVGDEQVDAGNVHVYDAAGADVEVADFAIAHLALGQADVWAGGMDQRIRKFLEQGVISRFARKGDGVAFGFGAESPAVEHGKNNWFRTFGHSWLGYRTRNFLPRVKCVHPKNVINRVSCLQQQEERRSFPALWAGLHETPVQTIPLQTAYQRWACNERPRAIRRDDDRG